MQAVSQFAALAVRGPGAFYALRAASGVANLTFQATSRSVAYVAGYAQSFFQKKEEEKADQPVEGEKSYFQQGKEYVTTSVAYTKAVEWLDTLAARDDRAIKTIAYSVAADALFSVALLWGANALFSKSELSFNSVLGYVAPVKLTDESILVNIATGVTSVIAWGSETVAALRS